jgi:hypothetical protein
MRIFAANIGPNRVSPEQQGLMTNVHAALGKEVFDAAQLGGI